MIVVLFPVWRLELMAWLAGLAPVPAAPGLRDSELTYTLFNR